MSDVTVLIWDFDGTLYKPNPVLFKAVREAEYKTIMETKGWTHEKAISEFEKLYKHVTPSATQTVAKICGVTTTQAALQMEKHYDRRPYLVRDEKLIDLFKKLQYYTHYILANGVRHRLEETLEVLGVDKHIFKEIVTSEISGENKPSEKGYNYILGKTELPPSSHMMIGDRESVDLVPAKNVGMKTCFVWGESKVADISVPTVYDLVNVL